MVFRGLKPLSECSSGLRSTTSVNAREGVGTGFCVLLLFQQKGVVFLMGTSVKGRYVIWFPDFICT